MPLTRADKQKQFVHFFTNVLQIKDDDVLYRIFESNQFTTMDDIIYTGDDFFSALQYIDDDNRTKVSPLEPLLLRLRAVKAYYYYLKQTHGTDQINWEDTTIVNSDNFDTFRITEYDPQGPTNPNSEIVNEKGVSKNNNFRSDNKSLAAEFRKGVKRDKSAYTVLKDERNWDSWRRRTVATMHSHGCQNITNPLYKPTSVDETLLLREQNNFMYDVFATILQTMMGGHYVQMYEETRDAQSVWREYSYHMKTSTSADLQIEELMTTLTSLRLSQNYRGTTQKFLIDWLGNMRQYEKLTPLEAHFPPTVKKAMLQNAVQDFKAFKQAKTQEQIEIARGGGPLLFSQYVNLLLNISSAYDKKLESSLTSGSRRLINIHQQDGQVHYEYEDHQDDAEEFLEDQYFGSYLIQATDRARRFRPSLPRRVWSALSKADQDAWDQVSNKGKWDIIKNLRSINISDKVVTNSKSVNSQVSPITVTTAASTAHTDATTNRGLLPINNKTTEPVDKYSTNESTRLINATKANMSTKPHNNNIHQADLRSFLSEDYVSSQANDTDMDATGGFKYKSNTHIMYTVSRHQNNQSIKNALIDRGANGGMAGEGMKIIAVTDRKVDVSGIDNHELTGLKIVTAGGVVKSQRGEVIAIIHQMAHVPGGKTIISSPQLEHFGIDVDDKNQKLQKGKQCLTTPEGYVIPMNFINGLPYIPIRPFSKNEWDTLAHVVLSSDTEWDPSILDSNITDNEMAMKSCDINPTQHDNTAYARIAEYGMPKTVHANFHLMDNTSIHGELVQVNDNETRPSVQDFNSYRKYFLDVPPDVIKRTFKATTQFARSGWITGHIRNTMKAPFPAMNVIRRNEPVATDTIFSNVSAIANGSTCAQLFVGTRTKFASAIGMHSDSQFIHALQDTIRKYGAMDQLVSDGGEALISNKVRDVLRHLCIRDWHSEPHYQHQNPAERRYRDIKTNLNSTMNASGAPANCWLLCLHYVIFIMNRTALQSINWRTPYERLYGNTPDISMIYRFKFFESVYVKRDESRGGKQFPSSSNEIAGRFVGFSEDVGHGMTYIVLTDNTKKLLYRSRVKLASISPNLRIQPAPNNTTHSDDNSNDSQRPMAIINFDDMIGRTYLSTPNEDGTRRRMRIIEQIDSHDEAINTNPNMIRFRAVNSDETVEDIIAYRQLLDKLESEDGESDEWKFTAISNHKGPLKQHDPEYKGSSWNVFVEWENGETTWEPLSLISKSDPVTCAIYARDNDLLNLPGWTRFKQLARRQKRLIRMANQAKLKSFRNRPVFKFGIQVPRDHRHAMELDRANGNNLWKEAEDREFNQIDEYETFIDLGIGNYPGKDFKRIKVHLVYDCKPSLKRKARLVANGNLTETPIDSIYSSVVSLRGLKTTIFIAELNKLETWGTDVGNAYLEAYTNEKIYIIAGDEFGARAGHTLIIKKALYGLKSSGKRWWERCSEILSDMGFFPSKAEDDIWLRKGDGYYEYIARYVDDLAIVSKEPNIIIKTLCDKYGLKLKGSGPINYHLGCDFFRDSKGILCMSPKKYIERAIESYERMFGSKPKSKYNSPLEQGDHPELDTSEELNIDGIKQYQSLIGVLQWLVSLGRLDIATAVMTMSSFRAAPRKGHMIRVQRIFGYLTKMKHASIRFRTSLPDQSQYDVTTYDWEKSFYQNAKELTPSDAPEPLGPPVHTTTYVDANLCHDMLSGKSVTGVLHFLNKTPIHYFSKKQPVVETATYGSEYMAARLAVEQIMEIRTSLRYLGVNIQGPTMMFGDNRSVVDSSSVPQSRLHKRHVLLSFHRVREAIAAKVINFLYIPGSINPADILSKHWGYNKVWGQLKPLLFWEGNTMDI